jgi:hypothetical protein
LICARVTARAYVNMSAKVHETYHRGVNPSKLSGARPVKNSRAERHALESWRRVAGDRVSSRP